MAPRPQPRTSRALATTLHGPRTCYEGSRLPPGAQTLIQRRSWEGRASGTSRVQADPASGPVAPYGRSCWPFQSGRPWMPGCKPAPGERPPGPGWVRGACSERALTGPGGLPDSWQAGPRAQHGGRAVGSPTSRLYDISQTGQMGPDHTDPAHTCGLRLGPTLCWACPRGSVMGREEAEWTVDMVGHSCRL